MAWITQHYELLGLIAVVAVPLLGWLLKRYFFPDAKPTPTVNTTIAAPIQTTQNSALTNSAIASGSGISQTVNSPTVNVNQIQAADLPDILLRCDWPDALHSADNLPPVLLSLGSHIVRNRPWSLRYLGTGAVYNVRIADISFKGYVAAFGPIESLTDSVESVRPLIFHIPSRQFVGAHDLESLINHPPEGCDIEQYRDQSQIPRTRVKIPVFVTYDDKHGEKYRIRYLLDYDTFFDGGRMIRIPGIEKIGAE
jgi:hypothetical protein